MLSEKQIEELVELLSVSSNETRIYLGCDSVRFYKNGVAHAKYATVCIVHKDGKHGCRIFANKSIERDYDLRKDRPKMRMLNEAKKVSEMYIHLAPFIDEFDVYIHLDINLDSRYGSSCAANEAAGYVLGMTGVSDDHIKFKPDSFASSFGADHIANNFGDVN